MLESMRDWIVHRLALGPIKQNLMDRRVPKTPWYYGDGATLLLLFGVLIFTGALLSLTYSPAADDAYRTVEQITTQQTLGWFVRGLHYWSAGLMVVMLFFHLFRQILVAGYKFPREASWIIGVVLFFGFLLTSYLGYLLRWDERAVHGFRVALHMMHNVPAIGDQIVEVVQGGPETGSQGLARIYSLHVIWLPMMLVGAAGCHLYLIVMRGITSPAERRQPVDTVEQQERIYKEATDSETEGEPFHPDTAMKSGAMALIVFSVALGLTLVVGPPALMPEGNLTRPSMPAEEWWFWWYSGLIALLPPRIAPWFVVVFPVAVLLALMALPFVDRGKYRGMRKRPWAVGFVVVAVIALLALSDYRRRSPFTGWPNREPPSIPHGVRLSPRTEDGRVLFAQYGCSSCHAVGGQGPKVGPDIARLRAGISLAEIRSFTLHPPVGVAMPAYAGRMPNEEVDRVVEFVHVAQTFPRR